LYGPGDHVYIKVWFDRRVLVEGTPTLKLTIYDRVEDEVAIYLNGSGTSELVFDYLVPSADSAKGWRAPNTDNLDYDGVLALENHMNGSSIFLYSDNPTIGANLRFPETSISTLRYDHAIEINGESPAVLYLTSDTPDGTYGTGEVIDIKVVYNIEVSINGTGSIMLETGTEDTYAEYYSGNNTNTLVFRYIVKDGHSSLGLDVVDTRQAPWNINSGDASMAFVVNDVHHCPLAPNPQPGQQAVVINRAGEDPNIVANYALPRPGTAKSLSVMKRIIIRTTPPTVTKVYTSYKNATYGIGEPIRLFVDFDSPVSVKGSPVLEMATFNEDCGGDACDDATYVGGDGTSTLEFMYLVKFGDKTSQLDYKSPASLKVFSTWYMAIDQGEQYIRMWATNPETDADLTLPVPGLKPTVISPSSIKGSYHKLDIQTDGLMVRKIYSTLMDGLYSFGQQIDIMVEYTGVVVVTGIPELALDLGGGGKAHYVSGSGSSTLKFGYVAVTNDNTMDLSYTNDFALELPNGASIVSILDSTMNAVSTVPRPGEMGSLNYHSEIIITGKTPYIVGMSVKNGCGKKFGVGEKIEVEVEFDQRVKVPQGAPTLTMNSGAVARYVSGSGEKKLVFEYVVDRLDTSVSLLDVTNAADAFASTTDISIVANSDVIVVSANVITLPSFGDAGSLSYQCPTEVSVIAPVVTQVEFLQQDGVYSKDDLLSIKVSFSDPVICNGDISLELYTGEDTMPGVATYFDGGKDEDFVLFKYNVSSADVSSDLDYIGMYSLKMDELTMDIYGERVNCIKRSSTYPTQYADLKLPPRGSSKSLGRMGNVVLDSSAPRVLHVTVDHSAGEYTTGEKMIFSVRFDHVVMVAMEAVNTTYLYLNSNAGGDLYAAPAKFKAESSGSNTLQFEYVMGKDDEVAVLDYVCTGFCQANSDGRYFPRPLFTNGSCDIYTLVSGKKVCASLTLPVNAGNSTNLNVTVSVSRLVPKVVSLSYVTPRIAWGYGVGQEIQFDVLYDKPVMVKDSVANISLVTKVDFENAVERTGQAIYIGNNGAKLRFKYTVVEGDSVDNLDYWNSSSLSGVVLRAANWEPSIVSNSTLPKSHSVGSLSYDSRIRLDTSVPVVESIIPLKKPGKYVSGEKIAICVRFSLPVQVSGVPKLRLSVNSSTYAHYEAGWNEPDVNFDVLDTDVIFVYLVTDEHGNVINLEHGGKGALILDDNDSIMRKSTNATMNADVTVRDANDHDRSAGHLNGQWKGFYPRKVEVLMRDLWHESGSDLEVKLEHGGVVADLFGKVGEESETSYTGMPKFDSTFGEKLTSYSSLVAPGIDGSTEIQMDRHLNGLGYDYLFGDMQSENLALSGVSKQSTTKYSAPAGRANDGNVDGFFSRDSVTHTGRHGPEDENPWWQVRLEKEYKIGGIRVWNRELQQARDEIQVITVVAPNKDPLGNYELFMEYEGKNYTSNSILVDAEALNEAGGAQSMQAAVEAMNPMLGSVDVTRTPTTDWSGGYQGYRYTVTFTGHPGDVPKMKLKSANFTLTPDALVDISVIRDGVDNTHYNYKVEQDQEAYVNELFPFWVMIFNSSVPHPEDLDPGLGVRGLLKYACWFQEITSGGRVINLAPGGVDGQIVRVMLENSKYLSLAEVQVYESELNTLSQYKGGSPIAEKPLTQPYISEGSLDTEFKNNMYGGLWTLQIRDLKKYSNSHSSGVFKESNGYGKIGDWILMITDQVGIVHRFYSDQIANVLTLPKYGTLHYTSSTSSSASGFSSFNPVSSTPLPVSPGFHRNLGPCYGVDTTGLNGIESVGNHRHCPLNYGVGTLLSTQKNRTQSSQQHDRKREGSSLQALL
jgi:hypothetical protein